LYIIIEYSFIHITDKNKEKTSFLKYYEDAGRIVSEFGKTARGLL